MSEKVSIILTSYNRPKLVNCAIRSIRRSTLLDFQCVVVDDDSNDETLQSIHDTIDGDPRFLVIPQAGGRPKPEDRRSGPFRYSICINRGLKDATGDYITYLCDDDALYPRGLEARAKYLDDHEDVHVVFGVSRGLTYDGSSLWDSMAPPKAEIHFPDLDAEIDPDTGRPLDIANCCDGVWQKPMGGHLDHNQIMHRRICLQELGQGQPWWPEKRPEDPPGVGDAAFFSRLDSIGHKAYGVMQLVVTKRFHLRNYGKAGLSPQRE